MTTDPQTAEPVDFRTIPPKITAAATGWQAWWEDHDLWDGFLLYADLDTAKHHAAVDYIGEEYGWVPGDDPEDEAPDTVLSWVFEHERWHLLDNGRSTLVQLYKTATYTPAVPVAAPPTTEQGALREVVAAALYRHEWPGKQVWQQALAMDRETFLAQADAVLAVLPAPADRGAVLQEAADAVENDSWSRRDKWGRYEREEREAGFQHAADLLRRLAVEAEQAGGPSRGATGPQPETQGDVLAAALDGLHTLIATSSRDWQTYRVDAWLWAVLCGWDCEQAEHDETCTHGALEETAAMHGWDAATVAKARRYRAAVRAITAPAVSSRPGTEQEARPCSECRHPKDTHQDGDDPVTPGTCSACAADDPDEAHHDYRARAAS